MRKVAMMQTGVSVVANGLAETRHPLPVPPIVFGMVTFGVLLVLLVIVLQFDRHR